MLWGENREKVAVTGHWTQDTWLEPPVTYHWTITTWQPLALTILYVHFIFSARQDVVSISCLVQSYCDVASRISSVFQLSLKLGIAGTSCLTQIWEQFSRSFMSDRGKIVQSSMRRNIEKSASLHSLRSLPTTTLASLSLMWADFGLGLAAQDWYCLQLVDMAVTRSVSLSC